MGEIDLFCQNSNYDMFQKGDSMFTDAQKILQAEVDSHPLLTDGMALTFNDQTALINHILEYGSIVTGIIVIIIMCCVSLGKCIN